VTKQWGRNAEDGTIWKVAQEFDYEQRLTPVDGALYPELGRAVIGWFRLTHIKWSICCRFGWKWCCKEENGGGGNGGSGGGDGDGDGQLKPCPESKARDNPCVGMCCIEEHGGYSGCLEYRRKNCPGPHPAAMGRCCGLKAGGCPGDRCCKVCKVESTKPESERNETSICVDCKTMRIFVEPLGSCGELSCWCKFEVGPGTMFRMRTSVDPDGPTEQECKNRATPDRGCSILCEGETYEGFDAPLRQDDIKCNDVEQLTGFPNPLCKGANYNECSSVAEYQRRLYRERGQIMCAVGIPAPRKK